MTTPIADLDLAGLDLADPQYWHAGPPYELFARPRAEVPRGAPNVRAHRAAVHTRRIALSTVDHESRR